MEKFNCSTGKITFQTYKEGIEKKISLKKRKGKEVVLYKCGYCDGFHLSTVGKRPSNDRVRNKIKKYKPVVKKIQPPPPIKIKKTGTTATKIQKSITLEPGKLISKEMADALKRLIKNQ